MITVIHGDNELQVRKELAAIKEKTKQEIITLVKPDALTLRQYLTSDSMFGDNDKLVIVESMLEKGIASAVLDFIAENAQAVAGVFVEKKQLDRDKSDKAQKSLIKGKKLLDTLKKQIPTIRIIACNDYSLFNFLDDLVPANSKQILIDYQALIDNGYQAEEVYYMIVDHLRYLIIANDLGSNGLGGMHQFRAGKISSQARRFSEKQLVTIYQKLFEVEVAQKRKRVGEGSSFSMEDDLRFFLATAFAK